MDTSTRLQENISAMVDDALPSCEVELTLAALSAPEGRATWRLYHLIGDVLRGQYPGSHHGDATAGGELSAGFEARLAARLAHEEPLRADGLPREPREPRDDSPAPAVLR